ncbi:hypothetical protein ES703_73573 [subsurface metagenome]
MPQKGQNLQSKSLPQCGQKLVAVELVGVLSVIPSFGIDGNCLDVFNVEAAEVLGCPPVPSVLTHP